MSFIDINLGWTNYVQLAEKGVPEFRNNVIVLDGDVPQKREYRSKETAIRDSGNFIFLPLVIEEGLFRALKDHGAFQDFKNRFREFQGLPTMCVLIIGHLTQIVMVPMILNSGTLRQKVHWEIKQFCLRSGATNTVIK